MPWHIGSSDQCPASRPHAVIKDSDGSVEGCHATEQQAKDQMAALYANESEMNTIPKDLEKRYGEFGGREIRTVPFIVEEVRDSGAGGGQYTIRGHAAVFNHWSLDLGGFRERILPGAFDELLEGDPHVLHLWDHDSRYVLSSTRNKTLELRVDPAGLHFWSRVAPTSYAEDLRVLLDRGDISQSSFAFAEVEDDWRVIEENDSEVVERDIKRIGELYDVTTTAMGAYPTTDSSLVAERALRYARSTGRLADLAEVPEDLEDEERAWSGSASRYTDEQYAKACVLDRNDCQDASDMTAKQRYSLPVANPGSSWSENPDPDGVAAAAQRIGQVDAGPACISKAKGRLRRAYSKLNLEPPESLRSSLEELKREARERTRAAKHRYVKLDRNFS